jgi:hypothetical protein
VKTYPIRSREGYTPIIYGHESGINIIWTDDVSLDSKHESELYVFLGTSVLDISVPNIPSNSRLKLSTIPEAVSNGIFIAVACSDFNVRVLSLPLEPTQQCLDSHSGIVVGVISHRSIPTSVSLIWTYTNESEVPGESDESFVPGGDGVTELDSNNLNWLISSCSSDGKPKMLVTRIAVNQMHGSAGPPDSVVSSQQVILPQTPLKVSFNPSAYPSNSHSHLLVPCPNGSVYIYDPLPSRNRERDSDSGGTYGSWLASYTTRFTQPNSNNDSEYLFRRKKILDAEWALHGQVIIVLLADREWGVWDISGTHSASHNPLSSSSFALWGMIGSGVPSHISSNTGPKRSLESRSSLPTMTPNTRRVKEESLFVGQTMSSSTVARGGISVQQVPLPSADNTEDSVILWYNDTICYIDSLQAYWTRAANRSSGAKLQTTGGSLFGPGLTRIEGLTLHGQSIVSITQLIGHSRSPSKALLLATEHQLLASRYGAEKVIGRVNAPVRTSRRTHQKNLSQSLLAQGELDLGELDLMMDEIDGHRDVTMIDSTIYTEPDNEFMSGALVAPPSQTRQ